MYPTADTPLTYSGRTANLQPTADAPPTYTSYGEVYTQTSAKLLNVYNPQHNQKNTQKTYSGHTANIYRNHSAISSFHS